MATTTTRVKDIPTTATTAASDDYFMVDGATNGTRKYAHNTDAAAHATQIAAQVAAHDESAAAHLVNVTDGCVGAWSSIASTTSGGLITEFHDLLGYENHASQSTSDSQWKLSGVAAIPPISNNIGYQIPNTITLNNRAFSCVIVYGEPATPDANAGLQTFIDGFFGYSGKILGMPDSVHYTPGFSANKVNVICLSSSSDKVTVLHNDAESYATAINVGTFGVSRILAKNNSTRPFKFPFISLYLYNRAISVAEMRVISNKYCGGAKDVDIWIGDSITAGYYSSTHNECFAARASLLAGGHSCINGGVAGWRTDSYLSDPSATNCYILGARNSYIYTLGHNDIAQKIAVGTIESNISTHIGLLRAASPLARIVIGTILPRALSFANGQDATGYESDRLMVNQWIRNNYLTIGCDSLADIGAHAIMGQQAAASNTTYYTDGIHPTTAGHLLLAPVYAAKLK